MSELAEEEAEQQESGGVGGESAQGSSLWRKELIGAFS